MKLIKNGAIITLKYSVFCKIHSVFTIEIAGRIANLTEEKILPIDSINYYRI